MASKKQLSTDRSQSLKAQRRQIQLLYEQSSFPTIQVGHNAFEPSTSEFEPEFLDEVDDSILEHFKQCPACVIPIQVGKQVINALLGQGSPHTLLDQKIYEKIKSENPEVADYELPPKRNVEFRCFAGTEPWKPICIVNLPFAFGDGIFAGKKFHMNCVVLKDVISGMLLGRSWNTKFVNTIDLRNCVVTLNHPITGKEYAYNYSKRSHYQSDRNLVPVVNVIRNND